MGWVTAPQVWMALVTLSALEIVLGIDNIIFISIQASKLPEYQQEKARLVGLGLAMFICGGLFLLWKSTMEIHEKLELFPLPIPRIKVSMY